jgi:beta-1,4-mannosyltransferase
LLLQNPPAVPSIPICWFYCYVTGTKLVIDWHNYAYTIMTLTLAETHVIVKLATIIESYFGKKALYNFCVTKAMQEDLYMKWSIRSVYFTELINLFRKVINSIKNCICIVKFIMNLQC